MYISIFSKNITQPNINSFASTDKPDYNKPIFASAYSNQEYESQTPTISTKVILHIYLPDQELHKYMNMTIFLNLNGQL